MRTLPLSTLFMALFALAMGPGCGEGEAWTPEVDEDRDGFLLADDCDDTDPTVHPDSIEVCNGWDDDCDGVVDEADAVGAPTWYPDRDSDGFGDPTGVMTACSRPQGYTALAGDCNDYDGGAHPGAIEVCNGADEDCDGRIDEANASGALIWYRDADDDGHGHPDETVAACTQPDGYVAKGKDCNDGDSTVNPDMDEICAEDGVDEDCNGLADEDDPTC